MQRNKNKKEVAMEKGKKEMRMLPMKELRINENDGSAVIEGHAAVF